MTLLAATALAAPRTNHVFIVSFDGGKPAVMQQSAMPTLMGMMKEGAGTFNAQTIFPSITLVSHTSMLTGVGPAKHKIDWNSWAPEKGLVTVPTVFAEAKKNGLSTAMYVSKEKFKHLNLPGSVDSFEKPSSKSKEVATAVSKYIVQKKPNLCFIHFTDTDTTGHDSGWGSPEQIQAFGDEDTALKIVMDAIKTAGLDKDCVVILTADHGGHDKTHGSNSPVDMTIPWIAWGKDVKAGFSITTPITTYDTAATALWLLDVPVPAEWDGKPVTTAFNEVAAAAAPAKK
jgi:predicted AlkP superfamily pyrophosphatase or phosphodiesterase